MTLTRDAYGRYTVKFFTRLLDIPRSFFAGHDASRDAMMWMGEPDVPLPGEVEDERVELQYEQTRGGRFKIPEPRYYKDGKNHTGQYYKAFIERDRLSQHTGEDDLFHVQAGQLPSGYVLHPCTYKF